MTLAAPHTRFLKHSFIALMSGALMSCGNAEVNTADSSADNAPQSSSSQSLEKKNIGSVTDAPETPQTSGVSIDAIAKMSPSELMSAATVESNRLADVLSSVSDKSSADAAIAQMRTLGPQIKALGDRLETLDEGDMKFSIKTMKQMQSFAEAQMRVFNETGRIAVEHPELREMITEGFEDIEIDF